MHLSFFHPNAFRTLLAICAATCASVGCQDDAQLPKGRAAKGHETSKSSGVRGGTRSRADADAGLEVDVDAGGDDALDEREKRKPTRKLERLRSVTVQMTGMGDDVGRFVQLRLVSLDHELIAIGALHELPAADYSFEFKDVVASGDELVVLVWADSTGLPDAYDGGKDHAWMLSIPAGDRDARVRLEHGRQDSPIDLNEQMVDSFGTLAFEMQNTDPWVGQPFELRIQEAKSGRLVARHLRAVPGGTTSFEVFGVIRNGVQYRVEFAVDDDKPADGFKGDPAWRKNVTGSATGFGSMPGAEIKLTEPPPESQYVDVGF